jgi:hypothetical protein
MQRLCPCAVASIRIRDSLLEGSCQVLLLLDLLFDHQNDVSCQVASFLFGCLFLYLLLDVLHLATDEVLSLLLDPLRHLDGHPQRVTLLYAFAGFGADWQG